MIFRNLIFEPEIVKQRLRAGMVSHHEQQASKWNGEQQHRALWPAYNLNLAPPQASTEGLFQQTRLFSSVDNCIMVFLLIPDCAVAVLKIGLIFRRALTIALSSGS